MDLNSLLIRFTAGKRIGVRNCHATCGQQKTTIFASIVYGFTAFTEQLLGIPSRTHHHGQADHMNANHAAAVLVLSPKKGHFQRHVTFNQREFCFLPTFAADLSRATLVLRFSAMTPGQAYTTE
jgi:hypothetical protein